MNKQKIYAIIPLLLITACSSGNIRPESGQPFYGDANRSLGANMEILGGNKKIQNDDLEAIPEKSLQRDSTGAIADAGVHAGFAVASGLTASSVGFGLAGGALSLLSNDTGSAWPKYTTIVIVKQSKGTNPESPEAFKAALDAAFESHEIGAHIAAVEIDDDEATYHIKNPKFIFFNPALASKPTTLQIDLTFSTLASPSLIKRILPEVQVSANEIFAVYGIQTTSHMLINSDGLKQKIWNPAPPIYYFSPRERVWERALTSQKYQQITYIPNKDNPTQTLIVNCEHDPALMDKNGVFNPDKTLLVQKCFNPKYSFR